MSATSLEVVTLSIPNEDYTSSANGQTRQLPPQFSYKTILNFDIRTLSTNNADGNDQTGLLYTPDLAEGDACIAESAPYVQNATRRANLPPAPVIAIAPWTSGQCALNYMVAARRSPSNQGFVFFLTDDSATTPPSADDPQWNIEGRWKRENGFPVYAIPGRYGVEIMAQSANYTGNVTDVPFGHELSEIGVSPTDYVRLYVDINTGSQTSLPSLWVFLLIVLAVLLAIIATTSLSMHLIQRRRRRDLRRRIASGEVDLEALGIKRLTIPQELLDQMPMYVYGSGSSEGSLAEEKLADVAPTRRHFTPSHLVQPTCPICLDDFDTMSIEQEGSTVRELPCQHIFHPECVDSFLRVNSSLCPMCKKSALPMGYCPEVVTNAMVRRERNLRRIRTDLHSTSNDGPGLEGGNAPMGFSQRMRTIPGFGRRFSTAPQVTESQRMEELDMRVAEPGVDLLSAGTGPSPQARATLGQREWARQRALAMLGRGEPADPDVEESRRTPGWRKAIRRLFP